MKKCQKCNIEKPLSEFNKTKRNKDGLQNWCRVCTNAYKKDYYIKNRLDILETYKNKLKSDEEFKKSKSEYSKKWREENKEKLKIKKKEWRENNIEKIKKWRENNKEKLKILRTSYNQKKKKIDKSYNLKYHIRNMILKSLKRGGYSKKSKTCEILGCSYEEFKLHIESQFEEWMSWDNKGLYNGELNYGWDIDHIIPLSSAKNEEEILKLNHYTNLSPLCSKVNRDIKRDKY